MKYFCFLFFWEHFFLSQQQQIYSNIPSQNTCYVGRSIVEIQNGQVQ